MGWKVLQQPRSRVASDASADLLATAAALLPLQCRVIFGADRGFADTRLMDHRSRVNWHWRIRFKSSFGIDRRGHWPCQASRLSLALGEARFWHHVYLTNTRYGPVHLALGRRQDGTEEWLVVSDEPTAVQTFAEYGLRFDIEENFVDDQSNGFQLESSRIRSAYLVNEAEVAILFRTHGDKRTPA
jgi:hypothetical protein